MEGAPTKLRGGRVGEEGGVRGVVDRVAGEWKSQGAVAADRVVHDRWAKW